MLRKSLFAVLFVTIVSAWFSGCRFNPPAPPASPTPTAAGPTPTATPTIDPRPLACYGCSALPLGPYRDLCKETFCDTMPTATPAQIPTAVTATATPTPLLPATGTAPASPSPTAVGTTPTPPRPPASVPASDGVNGCDASNPRSVGPDGVCNFTLFFRCPGCHFNRSWPADQDHAHWKAPESYWTSVGLPVDPGGHAVAGICPGDGSESDILCRAINGRMWDATCKSIGGNFVRPLTGNVHLVPEAKCDTDPKSEDFGNCEGCYGGRLEGQGTYQVCLPAGARACIDVNDYRDDTDASSETYSYNLSKPEVGGCPHGEVVLTDHDVCVTYTKAW